MKILGGYRTKKNKIFFYSASLIGGIGLFLLGIKQTAAYLNTIVDSSVLMRKRNSDYIFLENVPYEEKEEFKLLTWWKRKKRLLPWRLLEIANAPDNKFRMKALHSLAAIKNLTDYQYQHMAQAITPQTAVSLARIRDVDQRFFFRCTAPLRYESKQDLIVLMRDLLYKLNKLTRHPCLKYFISNIFPTFPKFQAWTFYNDFDIYGFVGIRPSVVAEETVLVLSIEALLHHCIATGNGRAVVEAGALPLLFSCHRELNYDSEACILLGRLMMELSIYPEYLQDLYQTGWITVLAEWMQSNNQKLSIAAASCLANLDDDSNLKYEREVLLLHPPFKNNESIKTDIVLIHGLLGGVHYTWRQRGNRKGPVSIFGITSPGESIENLCARATSLVIDEAPSELTDDIHKKEEEVESGYVFVMSDIPVTEYATCNTCCAFEGNDKCQIEQAISCGNTNCWPKDWLPTDCKNLRVVGINYDTRLTDWRSWCPLRDRGATRVLAERCRKLLQQLMACGIGERPVIWIAHSMGGLLVKHMLIQAWHNSRSEQMKNFYQNTKGIVFLSTPHIGSPWATLHEAWRILFLPSTEVDELRYKSPILQKLHEEFKKFIFENPMEIISFVETKSMKLTTFEWEFHCVPPDLGDPGFGTIYEIPLGHMDICKPDGK
ncbi:unnamed protein product [Nezara viridula]|uniref:Protein SERAC1 n=1 Tax=Nezara viridula TaxID=85310 RepID=A0A9P0MQ64_NEZVI|nr:unnamed protein product [Nezara viridula]